MRDHDQPLYAYLRDTRISSCIAQDVVAARLGVSIASVSRLERGERRLTIDVARRWANALELDLQVALWRRGEEPVAVYVAKEKP